MKTNLFKIAAIMLVTVGSFTSCERNETNQTGEIFEENCIVKYMPPPDNCDDYMIVIENKNPVYNNYYKPVQLPNEFKIDSLRAKVKYSISNKKHNCGFGGYVPVINIIKIEKQ